MAKQFRETILDGDELDEYLTCLRNSNGGFMSYFRGHADANWKLVPTLYRSTFVKGPDVEGGYKAVEQRNIEKFFHEAEMYLGAFRRSNLRDRTIAQHYGLPTSLLDWTTNPFVALYFAVSGHSKEDGAVFHSYTSVGGFSESQSASSNFELVRIEPPVFDQRVVAQQSVFTSQSFGRLKSSFEPSEDRDWSISTQPGSTIHNDYFITSGKLVIPAKYKSQLYSKLSQFGITHSRLFPSLEALTKDIAKRISPVMFYGSQED